MRVLPPSFYCRWRSFSRSALAIRESDETSPISERLLQFVWHHQRLLRGQLKTLDGRSVQVLHPGFRNREAGPDFRSAVIRIGSDAPIQGDVEIDIHSPFWKSHRHDQNPAYKNVILHVIWEPSSHAITPLPTLPLKLFLDSPLSELNMWFVQCPSCLVPNSTVGKCAAPLRDLAKLDAEEIVRQAAQVRLNAKGIQFQARAQQMGWDATLWEGLLGALGYKHNVWPMRRLAELILVHGDGAQRPESTLAWQARLLGLSGLMPEQLSGADASANQYLRCLWDIWWRERDEFSELILPRTLWRFAGLRPANHPQRRLALASHWLTSGDLVSRLEHWFSSAIEVKDLLRSLLEVLQTPSDDFWSRHWTIRSIRMSTLQPLLGAQRATDLAINVVLPWFWIRAVAGKNDAFKELAERRYFAWPRAEDNAVLRLARQRLFGEQRVCWIKTAAQQQGILQIVRDFCDHSNALCDDCQFPELVGELRKCEKPISQSASEIL